MKIAITGHRPNMVLTGQLDYKDSSYLVDFDVLVEKNISLSNLINLGIDTRALVKANNFPGDSKENVLQFLDNHIVNHQSIEYVQA